MAPWRSSPASKKASRYAAGWNGLSRRSENSSDPWPGSSARGRPAPSRDIRRPCRWRTRRPQPRPRSPLPRAKMHARVSSAPRTSRVLPYQAGTGIGPKTKLPAYPPSECARPTEQRTLLPRTRRVLDPTVAPRQAARVPTKGHPVSHLANSDATHDEDQDHERGVVPPNAIGRPRYPPRATTIDRHATTVIAGPLRRCCVVRSEDAFGAARLPGSDCLGEFGERSDEPKRGWRLGRDLVVPAAQVLHEGVSGDDGLGGVVGS